LIDALKHNSITIAIVIAGAVAHSMAAWGTARAQNSDYDYIDWGIAAFVAVFSGMMFALIAQVLGASTAQGYLAACVGSFLGLDGARRLADVVLDTLSERIKRREP
jgi:hypothetical protein